MYKAGDTPAPFFFFSFLGLNFLLIYVCKIYTNIPRGARIDCHLRTILQITFLELVGWEGDIAVEALLTLQIVQGIYIIIFST